MTTFEMSVIFNSDSEEEAVEAIDHLGEAFTTHLPGWAASVKSIESEPIVKTFKVGELS
jgi:hypothetical protein